jgi:hypothetical protein
LACSQASFNWVISALSVEDSTVLLTGDPTLTFGLLADGLLETGFIALLDVPAVFAGAVDTFERFSF